MWPFSVLFGSSKDDGTAVVEGAQVVTFSPSVGYDKAKMIKELQSFLGKDGANVITEEDVAHLSLPYTVIGEGNFVDFNLVFNELHNANRGRNGTAHVILSKKGLNKLAKFGDIENGHIETKFGWKVYLKDDDIAGTARTTYIHSIAISTLKYMRSTETSNVEGLTETCKGCDASLRYHNWILTVSDDQIVCGNCSAIIMPRAGEWADKTKELLRKQEESTGIKVLPKEDKAA